MSLLVLPFWPSLAIGFASVLLWPNPSALDLSVPEADPSASGLSVSGLFLSVSTVSVVTAHRAVGLKEPGADVSEAVLPGAVLSSAEVMDLRLFSSEIAGSDVAVLEAVTAVVGVEGPAMGGRGAGTYAGDELEVKEVRGAERGERLVVMAP
ncbi:hypothetical protein [Nonomuraea sp. NPDC049309]|uniref:hypothetical protein n=1 Tax=Nonomuraea sp. NPDC049309 TaxID=3364350 RepID=UPI0037224E5B